MRTNEVWIRIQEHNREDKFMTVGMNSYLNMPHKEPPMGCGGHWVTLIDWWSYPQTRHEKGRRLLRGMKRRAKSTANGSVWLVKAIASALIREFVRTAH